MPTEFQLIFKYTIKNFQENQKGDEIRKKLQRSVYADILDEETYVKKGKLSICSYFFSRLQRNVFRKL
jgi:predicted transposase